MLDPSSSEEESDEVLEEERRDVLVAAAAAAAAAAGGCSGSLPRALPASNREPRAREPGRQSSGPARPASPSPSVLSEGREEQERLQKEEREKRLRLQLYVFIVRCIAYPFNAKQPTDMARRQQKMAYNRRGDYRNYYSDPDTLHPQRGALKAELLWIPL